MQFSKYDTETPINIYQRYYNNAMIATLKSRKRHAGINVIILNLLKP